MSVAEKVSTRLQRMKRGVPFPISGFYPLGSRTSVQKAMSRLACEGLITRVSKGYYVRPKPLTSTPSTKITASAGQVARTWAKEHGYKLVHQGQEAAYRLGLQTQAPVKSLYWSNGPSRRFAVGNDVVEVKNVTKRKLRWAERPEGELFRSLVVLSPESVELSGLQRAFKRLGLSAQQARAVLRKLINTPLPLEWQHKLQQFERALMP